MRTAPLNYLIAFVVAALLWVLTAIVLSGWLSEAVFLNEATVEQFVQTYRITVGVAAVLGLLLAAYWFFYGSRPTTVGELGAAKRKWVVLLLVAVALAVALLVTFLVVFRAETFTGGQYAALFGIFSLHTWLFYWGTTLLMSPRTVKPLPWLA